MNLKRAILLSALTYGLSFAIGLVTALVTGFDFSTGDLPSLEVWLVATLLTAVLLVFITLWYFKDTSIKPSAKEGLHFGLILIAVSFAIEICLVVVPMMFAGMADQILSYYLEPMFWITVIALVAVTTLVGWYKGKK